MNRTLAIFLFFAAAISTTYAATITINAGEGGLLFNPKEVNASIGDMIVWKVVGSTHSIVQSDSGASCTKSTAVANAFSSGPLTAPAEYNYTISSKDGPKLWYFCGVPQHCQSGMKGIINVLNSAAAPSGSAAASSTASPSASPSGTSGAGRTSAVTFGVLVSSLLLAVLLL